MRKRISAIPVTDIITFLPMDELVNHIKEIVLKNEIKLIFLEKMNVKGFSRCGKCVLNGICLYDTQCKSNSFWRVMQNNRKYKCCVAVKSASRCAPIYDNAENGVRSTRLIGCV